MQKLKYSSLVFASGSRRKHKEYQILLSLPDLKLSEVPVEDPQDLNVERLVRKKVEVVKNILKDTPFFVEHTVLEIDAWKGLPGGLTGVFMRTVGYEGICTMMQAYEQRTATAKTVIGYYYNNNLKIFVGAATGKIAREPRGKTDFTWDHIFIPDEGLDEKTTYAEMGERKHKISMRKKAAMEFVKYLSRHFESDETGNGAPTYKASDVEEKKSNTGKITILFLASDPTSATRLRLGEELREIQEKLQLARQRDRFKLDQRMSVRSADISQALLDIQPQIVHFSGHGTTSGALCFENQIGQSHPIQPDALAALFEQFASQVECVLLNACYSETQAKAIAKHINFVVGMNQAIGDKAAIAFAIGFYQALGAGRSVEEAYKLGCVQIGLQGIPEHLTPVLIRKGQIQS